MSGINGSDGDEWGFGDLGFGLPRILARSVMGCDGHVVTMWHPEDDDDAGNEVEDRRSSLPLKPKLVGRFLKDRVSGKHFILQSCKTIVFHNLGAFSSENSQNEL